MKSKIYEAFVIGATVSACAIAAHYKNSAIVIENDMIAGDDFGSVYNITYENGGIDGEERAFVKRVKEKLPEGCVSHALWLSDLIITDLAESGAKLLLCTSAADVVSENGLYRVRLFGTCGFSDILTKRVFDTTAQGAVRLCAGSMKYKKTLCAALYRKSDGSFRRIMTEAAADYVSARRSLLEQMKSETADGFELAAISPVFMYSFEKKICVVNNERYIVSPSVSYGSIDAAYNGGIECALAIC